MRRVVLTVLQ